MAGDDDLKSLIDKFSSTDNVSLRNFQPKPGPGTVDPSVQPSVPPGGSMGGKPGGNPTGGGNGGAGGQGGTSGSNP